MDYNGFGNDIFKTNGDYLVIDDLTTDIDLQKNIPDLERLIKMMEGGVKMVKVKVTENFYLGKFNEIRNLVRAGGKKANGYLGIGDIFECTEEMAEYLLGKNDLKRAFIEVIEVIPEKKKEEVKKEPVKKKTTTTKKTTKKTIAKK